MNDPGAVLTQPGRNGGTLRVGNPGPRTKRLPFTRALELVLRTRIPSDESGKLKKFAGRKLITAAAAGILRRAAEGDAAAFKEARLAVQGPDADDRDEKGPPQIIVNMISVAPQSASREETEITVNVEAVGKTN